MTSTTLANLQNAISSLQPCIECGRTAGKFISVLGDKICVPCAETVAMNLSDGEIFSTVEVRS